MYVISNDCISCGSCVDACPVGIIAMDDNAGHYAIDGSACLDCGTCADTCPTGAISQE